ncbi:MAG: hypothetical protein RIA63_14440, partial [Cyclobacteriaceae bacterium]
MMLQKVTRFIICLICITVVSCTSQKENDKLGNVYFDVTGSKEAVKFFEEGLLLLHSFEFKDAGTAFINAQKADSTMAMAYWGEALTYNHPLWAEQSYEEAIAALNKLSDSAAERVDKSETEIEKDFMRAVNILYGEGTKYERDVAYSKFMEKVYNKYPQSQEAAAFYALSLLGSVPVGRDEEIYERGAAIAKGILEENPNHPGALHYLIHSYDDPQHASAAVEAANRYMKVASAAGHALHMPSHIYVAMGMWDDVVRSNEQSYQASVDRMEQKKLNNDARGYHAFQWLLYGYLQQGRIDKATQIVNEMAQYTEELPSARARVHMSLIKGAYLVETEDWTGEASNIEIDQSGLNISVLAINHFVDGMKAYQQKNTALLNDHIANLEKERLKVSIQLENKGIALCSGVGWESQKANQLDVDQANVLEMELRSLAADMDGNKAEAESWLKKASELEKNISYSYGPPPIVKPSFELYGEWLINNDRAKDALAQFDYSLQRAPKRVLSLKGKLQAARVLGDANMESEIMRELESILQTADSKPT